MSYPILNTFQTFTNQANFTTTSTQASTTFYNLKSNLTTQLLHLVIHQRQCPPFTPSLVFPRRFAS